MLQTTRRQADATTVSAVVARDGVESLRSVSLTEPEKQQLNSCEEVLRKGLATFFEVGSALLTIKEKQLYRATHLTFERYCRERWGIGRSYAWRVIGAAERVKLLPSGNADPRPTCEFQIRPFLQLEPDKFPKAWNEIVSRAKGGKITPKLVESVVRELKIPASNQAAPMKKVKRTKRLGKIPLGEILMLLQETKRRVEKGQTEEALAALTKIECILF